jgi:hypothetical protein
VTTIVRRPERAQPLADERAGRADRRQLEHAARTDRSSPRSPSPRSGEWRLMPDRPILPYPTRDQVGARFRADLVAYLNNLFIQELGARCGSDTVSGDRGGQGQHSRGYGHGG